VSQESAPETPSAGCGIADVAIEPECSPVIEGPGLRRPADYWAALRAARRVTEVIQARQIRADVAFDRWLPEELRDRSLEYWTPLPVLARVADWLRETQARTVVDIGSGAGKFCVAAALLTSCRFIGLEQRASLVDMARALATLFDVADRVTFLTGDFGALPTPQADAYYLYNPFGEYDFDSDRYAELGVPFNDETLKRDLFAMSYLLAQAPAGTLVITYNGFGGPLPRSYEQIAVDVRFPCVLRLWRKRGWGVGSAGVRTA